MVSCLAGSFFHMNRLCRIMLIIISQYFCRLRSTVWFYTRASAFKVRGKILFPTTVQPLQYDSRHHFHSFFSLQSFEICPLTLLAPLGMPDGKTSSSHPSVTGQQSCVCCMPGAAASLRNLPISIQMVTSVSIQRVKL